MIKLKIEIYIYKWENTELKENIIYKEKHYLNHTKLNQVKKDILTTYGYDEKHNLIMNNFAEIFWGKYFTLHRNANGLIDESHLEECNVKSLNKAFDLENSIIKININPPIGACVGLYNGIHFFFHTNERDLHHRPHIHVKSEGIEFRIDLETLKILDKTTFKNSKKTKKALELVKRNQEELLNYWKKVVVNGESVKFKMFYPI